MNFIFGAYFLTATVLAVPYYNWQYAQSHGFGEWIFFGEFVATAQGYAWPYFFFRSKSESAVSHFSAAIDFHNEAALVVNRGAAPMEEADVETIVDYYRKALAEAKQADIAEMNSHFLGFGDHFKEDFARGLELVIDGYDKRDSASFLAGQVLIDRWGTWYDANFEAITK